MRDLCLGHLSEAIQLRLIRSQRSDSFTPRVSCSRTIKSEGFFFLMSWQKIWKLLAKTSNIKKISFGQSERVCWIYNICVLQLKWNVRALRRMQSGSCFICVWKVLLIVSVMCHVKQMGRNRRKSTPFVSDLVMWMKKKGEKTTANRAKVPPVWSRKKPICGVILPASQNYLQNGSGVSFLCLAPAFPPAQPSVTWCTMASELICHLKKSLSNSTWLGNPCALLHSSTFTHTCAHTHTQQQ